MKRFHDDFSSLLNGFSLETLENDPSSIYGLSVDLTLNYLNPAWFHFAEENDGEPAISERFGLGAPIGDALSGASREYYLDIFKRILVVGEAWHHDYECSSADKFRSYRQTVYPLYDHSGLVIVNSLVTEHPHDENLRKAYPPLEELYTQESGFITQCCNCRRVKRAPQQDVWDWVPLWVEHMPENTSHSFCKICYEYYYDFKYPRQK